MNQYAYDVLHRSLTNSSGQYCCMLHSGGTVPSYLLPSAQYLVVDGIAELHGAHLPQLRLAQLAQVRRGVPVGRRRAALRARGAGGGAVADLQVDVAVLGDEGRLGPVRLDAAALRGPVLRRPDAGEGVHLPPRRERDAPRRVVPEHADRDAVDEPPAS